MDTTIFEAVPKESRKFKKGFARIRAMFQLNYKNAVKHPIESIKWMAALYLNENPKYCWADLVSWVVYESLFDLRFKLFECHCNENIGFYCGKCKG